MVRSQSLKIKIKLVGACNKIIVKKTNPENVFINADKVLLLSHSPGCPSVLNPINSKTTLLANDKPWCNVSRARSQTDFIELTKKNLNVLKAKVEDLWSIEPYKDSRSIRSDALFFTRVRLSSTRKQLHMVLQRAFWKCTNDHLPKLQLARLYYQESMSITFCRIKLSNVNVARYEYFSEIWPDLQGFLADYFTAASD